MPIDPLDSIMGGLLRKGAIDPANKQRRMADATSMRQAQGIPVPGVAPNRNPPQQVQQPQRDQRAGINESAPVQPGNQPSMVDIVIDQLNEAIVTMKVEVGREPDRNRKRTLERQIGNIRSQVREMGGVPVEAHESVQEGLAKLRGFGAVGWESVQQELAASGLNNEANQMQVTELQNAGQVPVRSYLESQGYQVGWDQATGSVTATKGGTTTSIGPDKLNKMVVDPTTGGQRTFSDPAYLNELLNIGRTNADARATAGTSVTTPTGTAGPAVTSLFAAPVRTDIVEMTSKLMKQWGITPKTSEELYETARLMAERSAFSQKELATRELARFEENMPNEYAKASEQINEQASKMTAELQEDFASRGMFYSSVMSNNMVEINDETMKLIADVASTAAERVSNLRDEVKSIQQWEILEREVVYRQLETENRAEGLALTQMLTNLQIQADQMALMEWQTQVDASIRQQTNNLEQLKFDTGRADIEGDLTALASMAYKNPIISDMFTSANKWETFNAADPVEQGRMVRAAQEVAEFDLARQVSNAQITGLIAGARLSEQQAISAAAADAARTRELNILQQQVNQQGATTDPTPANLIAQQQATSNLSELKSLVTKTSAQLNDAKVQSRIEVLRQRALAAIADAGPLATGLTRDLNDTLMDLDAVSSQPQGTVPTAIKSVIDPVKEFMGGLFGSSGGDPDYEALQQKLKDARIR